MEFTPQEKELLRKYRQLSEYDKGRVDQKIDGLIFAQRKNNFTLYERGKGARGNGNCR